MVFAALLVGLVVGFSLGFVACAVFVGGRAGTEPSRPLDPEARRLAEAARRRAEYEEEFRALEREGLL